MTEIIKIELNNPRLYKKEYKIRTTGREGRSIETTIPREVFERECRKKGLTPKEGIEKLKGVWRYNNFAGIFLSFERKEKKK